MSKPDFKIISDNVLYTNSLSPLILQALSSDIYSNRYFLWDFGDGTTSSEESPTHVYTEVGEYDVTLSQYTSSGEISSSDSQPVTAVNLIPNSMDWASDSYSGSSIVASVKNATPFKLNVYNSWQEYDDNFIINLYAENSESIPFEFSDKDIHLKPTWRFLDENDEVIEVINLSTTKLYALSSTDGKIYISTNDSDDSVFVGTSSTAEFYFIDDTPSGVDIDEPSYLPTTIIASQPLSAKYGDTKFDNESYIKYPYAINSVFVDNVEPDRLYISSNGAFDFNYIKFQYTKVPYNIRIVDSSGNYIKTNPFDSPSVSSYEMEIGFTGIIDVSSSPSLTGNSLERFRTDFSNLGGFFESYFIPTSTTQSITLTASTLVDYTLNKTPTRYGIFSDENSNKIYRTSYVEDFSKSYIRKTDSNNDEVDGLSSNKFGALIDDNYRGVFIDSDSSTLEIYNTSFELISSFDLSSYDDFEIEDTILSSIPITSQNWESFTSNLSGANDGDQYGHAVKLNSDATRLVVGVPFWGGSIEGIAYVYDYNGSDWIQLGSTLSGEGGSSDQYGNIVDINDDGSIVAIGTEDNSSIGGYVKVYEYNGSDWLQLGDNLSGSQATNSKYGSAISLNSDGDRIVIGGEDTYSSGFSDGIVEVFALYGGNWIQLGSSLDTGDSNDDFGSSVGMNDVGDRIVVGNPSGDAGGSNSGEVSIYEYNGSNWIQVGSTLSGSAGDRLGDNVSINGIGDRIVASAYGASEVYVYEYNGTSWAQLGSTLSGYTTDIGQFNGLQMNKSGNRIIVGDWGFNSNRGAAYIYEYSSGDWVQVGQTITGDTSGEKLGTSVSFNDDGTKIAIGSPAFGVNRGIVQSYNADTTTNITLTSDRGQPSPAQICMTQEGNYLITLHDTADIIYFEDGSLSKIDLYDQIAGDLLLSGGESVTSGGEIVVVDENGDFVYQPAALELLSDNETLYIAYTDNGYNFIEKYSIDVDTPSVTSLSSIILSTEVPMDMVSNRDGDSLFVLVTDYYTRKSYVNQYNVSTDTLSTRNFIGYDAEYITIDVGQNVWAVCRSTLSANEFDTIYTTGSSFSLSSFAGDTITNVGGIAGDSYGNVWILDSTNDRVLIADKDDISSYLQIKISEDTSILSNQYVAYGDWNGFRWYNKFGYGGTTITYELSGESDPFIIYPKDKYNLQKINEDFDMTATLKSYRTTDVMFEYDHLFDDFLGSIFGDKYDDGTKFGRNVYEKIANFVINHSDIDTCTIDSLKSISEEVGIDFETDIVYPRDIKRIVDLFSIRYKKLWGDEHQIGIIEDYKGDAIEISSYEVSADPQVKFIATEKFNEYNTIIRPLIVSDTLSTYPLSDYSADWGWGLAVPDGADVADYYDFYELLPLDTTKVASIIDWDHPLTDTSIEGLTSYSSYMTENGIVSTILGDTLREGLNLYLD